MALASVLMLAVAGCAGSAPGEATRPAGEAQVECSAEWPLWMAYKKRFVQSDGRVVDFHARHSTSEGQAYGLFHALVARDESAFRAILAWADAHLAKGELGQRLPAWQWGERDGQPGRVLDPNAASDADLIMAYALVHAAVVFDEVRFAEVGGKLLGRIAAEEVAQLPGLGPMLMPGPYGFDTRPGFWRVNPSYQPVPLLRWAARVDPDGPWAAMVVSAVRLAEEVTPERFYPDWAAWSAVAGRFVSDPERGGRGSYDAIRAYLWPALMAKEDPMRGRLLARGTRLVEVARQEGWVPEQVDAFDATKNAALSAGPVGFQAVGAVVAAALGDEALAAALEERVAAERKADGLFGEPAFYYDHNLLLFAQGYSEGRYRFRADGGLELGQRRAPCAR